MNRSDGGTHASPERPNYVKSVRVCVRVWVLWCGSWGPLGNSGLSRCRRFAWGSVFFYGGYVSGGEDPTDVFS